MHAELQPAQKQSNTGLPRSSASDVGPPLIHRATSSSVAGVPTSARRSLSVGRVPSELATLDFDDVAAGAGPRGGVAVGVAVGVAIGGGNAKATVGVAVEAASGFAFGFV